KKLVQRKARAGSQRYQKIDFPHVGLMGHSRGGEGRRAAYEQYRAPGSPWPARIGAPIGFEALFEIGPVDGQTGPRANPNRLNADGLAWTVLLPNCDGDVFNLQGVKPFDRMLLKTSESPARFKATYTVGARTTISPTRNGNSAPRLAAPGSRGCSRDSWARPISASRRRRASSPSCAATSARTASRRSTRTSIPSSRFLPSSRT